MFLSVQSALARALNDSICPDFRFGSQWQKHGKASAAIAVIFSSYVTSVPRYHIGNKVQSQPRAFD